MIKVSITKDNAQYKKIVVSGHALYDDYGMNLNDAYDMIALDNTEYQIQIIEKSKEFNLKE